MFRIYHFSVLIFYDTVRAALASSPGMTRHLKCKRRMLAPRMVSTGASGRWCG